MKDSYIESIVLTHAISSAFTSGFSPDKKTRVIFLLVLKTMSQINHQTKRLKYLVVCTCVVSNSIYLVFNKSENYENCRFFSPKSIVSSQIINVDEIKPSIVERSNRMVP
jgi:hypothetical protein